MDVFCDKFTDYLIYELLNEAAAKGYSDRQLSKISGLNKNTIYNLKNGMTKGNICTYLKIAEALEIDLGDVISMALKKIKVE